MTHIHEYVDHPRAEWSHAYMCRVCGMVAPRWLVDKLVNSTSCVQKPIVVVKDERPLVVVAG